ncbi:MAG: GNAT family N-acetyltransferase [Verrucomicrobiota bacterium]|nr:GNAT family N-acetyltransferase [Verrucomicrobiota bacterium]
MAPQFSVEALNREHVEPVVALLQAQMHEHEIATSADALRSVVEHVLADARHGFVLVAAADRTPVGIAYAAAHLSAEHGGVVGWLEELYVSPGARGSGVGSALLAEVARRARALDWRALELEVVAGHERAMPLYLRHEFTLTARTRFTRVF